MCFCSNSIACFCIRNQSDWRHPLRNSTLPNQGSYVQNSLKVGSGDCLSLSVWSADPILLSSTPQSPSFTICSSFYWFLPSILNSGRWNEVWTIKLIHSSIRKCLESYVVCIHSHLCMCTWVLSVWNSAPIDPWCFKFVLTGLWTCAGGTTTWTPTSRRQRGRRKKIDLSTSFTVALVTAGLK